MIGGGAGSNIGQTHLRAARSFGKYRLVTGVFSVSPDKSRDFATSLGVEPARRYGTWQEMLERETSREDGIEAVSIVTPNDSHYEIAKACLEKKLHVICDKPLTIEATQAFDLVSRAEKSKRVFCVTYNYSGYPMIRQARAMVQSGAIGKVRMVHVEQISGWAATLLESQGHKQATWRMQPEKGGKSSVVADIGVHAHHLARFVSGLEVEEISAKLTTVVPGRVMDDNAYITMKLSGDVTGTMWLSMAAVGHLNALKIRVYGDAASLEWLQEQPEVLTVRLANGTVQTLSRGLPFLSDASLAASHLWPGHPEGFDDAFANIYNNAAEAIAFFKGEEKKKDFDFPTVRDGALGVAFVDAAVQSNTGGGAWVRVQSLT